MVWSTPHSIGTSRSAPRALERIQMSADERVTKPATERGKPRVQRLKPNAGGLWGVMFMAVDTAAPITAMVGNVPVAIGSGNGANAPARYLMATIVLSLFALGYSAIAKHITSTGAFYGYISHGLGRVVGMAAGALTTLAYVVFEAALDRKSVV